MKGSCDHCSEPYSIYDRVLDERFCTTHWQDLLEEAGREIDIDNYVVLEE